MSTVFPGSAVGLVSLFLFVVFLATVMGVPGTEPLVVVGDLTTGVISQFEKSASSVISGDEGLFGFGIISSFFIALYSIILIPLLFILQIFLSFAVFIGLVTLLPIEISGIISILVGVGLVFNLLKFVIPE